GPVQADAVLERDIVACHFWGERDDPERKAPPNDSDNNAHGGTFEKEQSNDMTPASSQSHAQCDLAAATAKPNEQQICDVTACDQQDGTDCDKQRNESRSQVACHVFRCADQNRRPSAVRS